MNTWLPKRTTYQPENQPMMLSKDYSNTNLPKAYRSMIRAHTMELSEEATFLDSLKHFQLGISFQCVPQCDSGREKLFTNISVMHDFRALEPLKDNLPGLYQEIAKKAYVSEAGKYYLLDSIKGYRDE